MPINHKNTRKLQSSLEKEKNSILRYYGLKENKNWAKYAFTALSLLRTT